jgi:HK97 family phage major capsid protein
MTTSVSTVGRSDASTLIPADYSNALLAATFESSAALSAFPRIPLGTKVTNYPLLATLPSAAFVTENVDDSTGIKPTSKLTWKNKQITAEEIAVIVPVHENTLEDSTIDLWATIMPAVAEAFGVVIDNAIFFGVNKPTSWRAGLIPTAKTAGNIATHTGSSTVGADLVAKLSDTMALVEKDGNDISTWFAGPRSKAKLRGLRATTGELIFSDLHSGAQGDLYGSPIRFIKNGTWDDSVALFAGVDASKVRIGYRSDMSYKVLDQASLTNADGTQFNLAERDMVALRVKMRLGWEIANNVNRLSSDPTSAAVLVATAGNS